MARIARSGRHLDLAQDRAELLILLGGALGVVVAYWGLELLKAFRPSDNAPFWTSYTRTFDFFTIKLDFSVLAFNFTLALLTGLLFGLLPAIQSSFAGVNETLKEGAGGKGAPTEAHQV